MALILGTSGLLAGALVRCTVPELPPPQQALPTPIKLAGGAFVVFPGTPIDRPALVASLKEMKLSTVIIPASANATGEVVNERVALAVELQRELGASVFIGTYESLALNGKSIEVLLQTDPSFVSCYPSGPRLDPNAPSIDKLRLCSQDVSNKIAAALRVANASAEIGCYITHQPELVDRVSDAGRAALAAFFHDAAAACAVDKRHVAVSPVISAQSGDPFDAGVLLRETLQGSDVDVVMLEDGVATVDPLHPRRAAAYYLGVRTALVDRPPPVAVWAKVEAFDCEPPSCAKTHPTAFARLNEQLCAARARVDGIVMVEYLEDLSGGSVVKPPADAAADAQSVIDDADASAQLRRGYLEWSDAGAPPCK